MRDRLQSCNMQTQDYRSLAIGPKQIISAGDIPDRGQVNNVSQNKQFFMIHAFQDTVLSSIKLVNDADGVATTHSFTLPAGHDLLGVKPGEGSVTSGLCIVYMGH